MDQTKHYTIEVVNVSKKYPVLHSFTNCRDDKAVRNKRREVLRDVNFTVQQGEAFGLLGQNGSGKTTLIKILATLLLYDSGSVRLAGYDSAKNGAKIRSLVGYVSGQERDYDWRLSGIDNLLYFCSLYNLTRKESDDRIAKLAEVLQVERYLSMPYKAYSAGVKQRFSIIRGLINDPLILLLDEPTKSLDKELATSIRRYIREELIEKEGRTTFFVTHDEDEAAVLADRTGTLIEGTIVI